METSARDCIADLRDLTALGEYEHAEEARQDIGAGRIADLGLDPEAFDRYNAEEAIDELPLAVERTTTFEVILGVGGPDRRLCLECDHVGGEGDSGTTAKCRPTRCGVSPTATRGPVRPRWC
ncbi:MAG TPA: hypothetical protein VMF55_07975 [Solirubrobacterales bacterium]|nr:hypothetical protein [Solirubrobacterales bacterium]